MKLNWWELDEALNALETDVAHRIEVQREALPIVFVPGIMGSRLRRGDVAPTANGAYPGTHTDGMPSLRWDPGNKSWMAKNYMYKGARHRKAMLIGPSFTAGFLQVADSTPRGDGLIELMDDYRPFLVQLRSRDWGTIGRVFEFPVFACGYDWTRSAEDAAIALASRIREIIDEARRVVGLCDKVILVSHSMGGLVTRACAKLAGAEGQILGIVHSVQPVNGSAAAYWRIKAGFEGDWTASAVLGNEGRDTTVILGNSPGGLQLLPNARYRTNIGAVAWLTAAQDGRPTGLSLPVKDPYEEIYRVPAEVRPLSSGTPSTNTWWGLVDPALLAPGTPPPAPLATGGAGSLQDASDAGEAALPSPWEQYAGSGGHLDVAKSFHDRLAAYAHPKSIHIAGAGSLTPDRIDYVLEACGWTGWSGNYKTRAFSGNLVDAKGKKRDAVLQPAAGVGDATVPTSSAQALFPGSLDPPGSTTINVAHQPAFENAAVQAHTIRGIAALALEHFKYRTGR